MAAPIEMQVGKIVDKCIQINGHIFDNKFSVKNTEFIQFKIDLKPLKNNQQLCYKVKVTNIGKNSSMRLYLNSEKFSLVEGYNIEKFVDKKLVLENFESFIYLEEKYLKEEACYYGIQFQNAAQQDNEFLISASIIKKEEHINITENNKSSLKPKEIKYYKKEIEVTPNSIVYLTGLAKKDIEIFASISNEYPSITSYDWRRQEESLTDNIPNLPKKFYPFNFDVANKMRYIENPLDQYNFKSINSYDIIHLLFHQEWLDEKVTIYIAVANISETQENGFEFKLEKGEESDFLPKELKNKYGEFMKYFNKTDGFTLSKNERMEFQNKEDFIYGEIDFIHFYTLLKIFKGKIGGEFWDLGCGIGKALVCAAFTDFFSKICGVELLSSLHGACNFVIKDLLADFNLEEKNNISTIHPEFNVINNDLLKADWSNGDLIFISDRCFSSDVMKEIQTKALKLKPGSRIITLQRWEMGNEFEEKAFLKIKMSWGITHLFILERVIKNN